MLEQGELECVWAWVRKALNQLTLPRNLFILSFFTTSRRDGGT